MSYTQLLQGPFSCLLLVASLGLSLLLAGLMKYFSHGSRTGIDDLVGKIGMSITELNPRGQIRLRGEIWEASCFGYTPSPIPKGRPVKVLGYLGLLLLVEPAAQGEGA